MPNNQGKLDETWNAVLPGAAGIKAAGGLYLQAMWANENSANAYNMAKEARDKAEAARSTAANAQYNAERAFWLLRPGAAGQNEAGAVWVALGNIQSDLAAIKTKLGVTPPVTP